MELFRITLWRALLQDLDEGDSDSAKSDNDNEDDVICFSQASSDFDLAPKAVLEEVSTVSKLPEDVRDAFVVLRSYLLAGHSSLIVARKIKEQMETLIDGPGSKFASLIGDVLRTPGGAAMKAAADAECTELEIRAAYRLALKKKIQALRQWRQEATQVFTCWSDIADDDEMVRELQLRELGRVFSRCTLGWHRS